VTARIHALDDADDYRAAIPGLAALIVDAVDGGAGVNFLAGTTAEQAAAWWQARLDAVRAGVVTVFVAVDGDGAIVGSTLIERSTNQNSPHRAEIGKVLVLRSARRQGLATALMAAAEARAHAEGRWMLLLDTVTGSAAEAMYHRLGWREYGVVPGHALATDGTPARTTFFYKDLR
jgi:GNAT superfamily N-acetyltransferase